MSHSQSDKYFELFFDLARGLATFNGAGVAGVIALMQGQKSVSGQLILGGGLFLLGIIFAALGWLILASSVAPGPGLPPEKRRPITLQFAPGVSLGLFLSGVMVVFSWAAGSPMFGSKL